MRALRLIGIAPLTATILISGCSWIPETMREMGPMMKSMEPLMQQQVRFNQAMQFCTGNEILTKESGAGYILEVKREELYSIRASISRHEFSNYLHIIETTDAKMQVQNNIFRSACRTHALCMLDKDDAREVCAKTQDQMRIAGETVATLTLELAKLNFFETRPTPFQLELVPNQQ